MTIVDGWILLILGKESIKLTGMGGKYIRMLDVMYIPDFDRRLLSVDNLADRGLRVESQQHSSIL